MTDNTNPNMQKRIEWLDILRGIAAMLVVLSHLSENILQATPPNSFLHSAVKLFIVVPNFGKVGVVVFFILSGYVIPFSLKKKNLMQFTITRFFRLYPIYWGSIIIYCLLTNTPLGSRNVLINFTMLQKFVGVPDLIGAFWTLQIELIFYFICAIYKKINILFSLKYINYTRYGWLGLALLMSLFRFFLDKKLPAGLCLALYLMFTGLSLKITETSHMKFQVRKELVIFYIIFIPVCFLAYNRDYGFGETWYGYLLGYSIGIGLFILGAKYKPRNTLFIFLGTISYSLYLLHPLVIYFYSNIVQIHNYLLLAIAFSASIILISTIGFYVIERPFAKIGKKLEAFKR